MLTIQHENQRIFLKEKRTFEPDLFLSQAARRYGCERTAYSLCSLDHTTHFLLAPWNTRKSCQKQSGAHGGKCAPTTTTHHAQAAGETASMHEDGSNSPCALSKGCSGLEANALPRSTRNPAAVASGALPPVLEAQVKGLFSQAQGSCGNHRIDQRNGDGESALGLYWLLRISVLNLSPKDGSISSFFSSSINQPDDVHISDKYISSSFWNGYPK